MITAKILDIQEVMDITKKGLELENKKMYELANILVDQAMKEVLLQAEKGKSKLAIYHKEFLNGTIEEDFFRTIISTVSQHINKSSMFSADWYCDDSEDDEWVFILEWDQHSVKTKIAKQLEFEKKLKEKERLMEFKFKTIIPKLLVKDNFGNRYIRTKKETSDMIVYLPKNSRFDSCMKNQQYYPVSSELSQGRNYAIYKIGDDIGTSGIYDSDIKNKRILLFRKLGKKQ